MNVMVINHCAQNKGDRAVLVFVLRELARNEVSSVTVSMTQRSFWTDTDLQFGSKVRLVPWGWNVESDVGTRLWGIPERARGKFTRSISYPLLRYLTARSARTRLVSLLCDTEFYRELRRADFVISTGGHHITTLLEPDAVSPQLFDMALTLVAGKKLALWSQTIGPLAFAKPKNRRLVKSILAQAAWVCLRDTQSLGELRKLNVGTERVRQSFESVIGLNDAVGPHRPPTQRDAVVGISVYGTQPRSPSQHAHYVRSLAEIVDHSVAKGYVVRFFPMQIKGSRGDDRPLIHEIVSSARRGDKCFVEEDDLPPLAHIRRVADCRLFIGHKTHSIIFALTSGTPVIAIAYHSKAADFMMQYELSELCIRDDDLSGDSLIAAFERASRDLDGIAWREFERSREMSETVRRDFRDMVKTVSERL